MFFFKQKTAYEMRISDWSSDVCSSDLEAQDQPEDRGRRARREELAVLDEHRIGFEPDARVADAERGGEPPARGRAAPIEEPRSEARRGGKEWGSTGRSRWSPYH